MPKRKKKASKSAAPIPMSKPAKRRTKKKVKSSGKPRRTGGFLSPVKFLLILLAIIAALIIKEKFFTEDLPTQAIDLDSTAPITSPADDGGSFNGNIDTPTNLFSK